MPNAALNTKGLVITATTYIILSIPFFPSLFKFYIGRCQTFYMVDCKQRALASAIFLLMERPRTIADLPKVCTLPRTLHLLLLYGTINHALQDGRRYQRRRNFFFFFSAPLAEIQKLNYDVSEKLQYVSVKTRLCQQYIRNQTSA